MTCVVIVNGVREEFEGSNAFYNSLKTANHADRPNSDGVSTNNVVWIVDGVVRSETLKGQRTGASK